jgi:hypothetical protein
VLLSDVAPKNMFLISGVAARCALYVKALNLRLQPEPTSTFGLNLAYGVTVHALAMGGKVAASESPVADLALLCAPWRSYTVRSASWPLGVLASDVAP